MVIFNGMVGDSMYIFTLIKANIKHKKGAFKSIVILMFVIALSITSIISVTTNIKKNLDKAMNDTDACDIVAFFNDRSLMENTKRSINSNSNVERTEDLDTLCPNDVKVNDKPVVSMMLFAVCNSKDYKVFNNQNNSFIDNSEELKAGEIYVPITFKALYDCTKDSTITFKTGYGIETFKIKGFIQEPYFGAYTIDKKFVYISSYDFNRISYNDPTISKSYICRIYQAKNSNLSVTELKKELNQNGGLIDYSQATYSKQDSNKCTTLLTDIFGGILITFVILLVVIMLIVMGHSISTNIDMEYKDLGIMKSVGFTKGEIRKILCIQYLIAEIIGAIIGFIVAIPCVRLLGNVFQPITGIIATSELDSIKCCLVLTIIILICNIFVFGKTYRIAKISPIKAINGGHEDVYFDSRIRVPLGEKVLSFRLALRQLTSSSKQYLSLVVISAILVFFMMSITTLATCMTTKALQENFGATVSDLTLKLNDNFTMDQDDTIHTEISKISPIEEINYVKGNYYSLNGYEYYGTVFDRPEAFKSVASGRAPLYDNEIVITQIIADELDKKIGDSIEISNGDKSYNYYISGIYQTTNDVGRCFGINLKAIQRIDKVIPNRCYILLKDSSRTDETVRMLNEHFPDYLEAQNDHEGVDLVHLIQVALDVITVIIYCISGIFALVVINMVCGKTFIKEKHDIGIYKAIGVTCNNLRWQFIMRFVFVALVGSILGNVFFLLFNDRIMSRLFYSVGIYSFGTQYHTVTFVLPVVFICACFLLFSLISTRKVKKISPKELIVE